MHLRFRMLALTLSDGGAWAVFLFCTGRKTACGTLVCLSGKLLERRLTRWGLCHKLCRAFHSDSRYLSVSLWGVLLQVENLPAVDGVVRGFASYMCFGGGSGRWRVVSDRVFF